jgi:transmembrane sensor
VRGEALFDVAKDANRPFIVEANGVRVRALGTSFAVRVEDSQVDVTVTEGSVEVSRSSADKVGYRVTSNEHAIAQPTGAVVVAAMQPEAAQRRLAWRNGMVAFAGEPLRAAVLEVNRHNQRKIVIDGAALAERPLVGIFRATDAETFARTVAAALDARLEIDGDTLRLRPLARH